MSWSAVRPTATQTLVVVLAGSGLLRLLWLAVPDGALIFDEAYYVNAARAILGWPIPEGQHYADALPGLDPNTEHPPLGKLLMSASMVVFGDNALGWRLPSVLAGVIALLALYGVVRAAGGQVGLALVATAIYALDPLTFIHGRIGVLDMTMTAFMLIAAWAALRGRWKTAGACLALASLVKVTAAVGLLAILAILAVRLLRGARTERRRVGMDALVLVGSYGLVGAIGFAVLSQLFTNYETPVAHIVHMFSYGLSLRAAGTPGAPSLPWEWLLHGGQFDYLRVDVNTMADGSVVASRPSIQFRAVVNPIMLGTAPLALLLSAWRAARTPDNVSTWGVAWAVTIYVSLIVLAVAFGRVTYLFYFLPIVPALAVLTAVMLRTLDLPRVVVVGYLIATAGGFIAFFPFRQFPL